MENIFSINKIESNIEILAKIARAAASKYDCGMRIFYQEGRLQTVFYGDDVYKPQIITEVLDIIC